jgi:hypothetical protein
MGKREDFARALLVKDVAAVSTVVLSIREAEGRSTSHANIRVGPLGGLQAISKLALNIFFSNTYRTAVQHALGNVDLWWEMESVPL